MYIAHFEVSKEEPKRIYFEAKEREPKRTEFRAPENKVIKFIITKDKTLEVE